MAEVIFLFLMTKLLFHMMTIFQYFQKCLTLIAFNLERFCRDVCDLVNIFSVWILFL